MSLLKMNKINKSFWGKSALSDVDFCVNKGEIHALLGENGAGKTTLMNILYGIYAYDSGEVNLKGEDVVFSSPKDAIKKNIGMVHQHFALVPTLTVSENITLGLKEKNYPFVNRKQLNQDISEIAQKYGLDIHPEAKISSLSVGEQQRVEIMKLLYRDAELLILDEPTAVLTPQEIESFFEVLNKLRDGGHSVILITHRIPEVMAICNNVTVLRDGEKVFEGSTDSISGTELSGHMIGRELNKVDKANKNYVLDEKGLEIESVSLKVKGVQKLNDVSLSVRPGEILGLAGVSGNGQKALAEVIAGIKKNKKGSIRFFGNEVTKLNIVNRKKLGLAYISDERMKESMIGDMNLVENMFLNKGKKNDFIKNGFINFKAIKQKTNESIDEYEIKAHSIDTHVRYLSGGNQQKIVLARELLGEPKIIIAIQPTRGLDIGAAEFVRKQLIEYSKKGCCVLLISTDLEEIFALSSRIAVMYSGKIMDVLNNDDNANIKDVGLLMAGKKAKKEKNL